MERLFLGIDQGSSGTKGVLLDMHGQHYQEFSVPVSTHVLDTERIEQDPQELVYSVRRVADDALRVAARLRRHIAAIGLSVQRSGVLAWSAKSGEPLHPLISHRDRRAQALIDELQEHHSTITAKTGLPVLPNYAAGKILELQRQFPDSSTLISTLDSYLVQAFAGETRFFTEDSMAARTMLYNLESAVWDEELCALFSVLPARLPAISPSLGRHGTYRGIPITALLGDQQAGLFGRLAEGISAIVNLGTGSWISVFTGEKPVFHPGLITGVFYTAGTGQREFHYGVEAVSPASGPLIDYIMHKLNTGRSVADLQSVCLSVAPDRVPVAFVPLTGTGTPEWRADLPFLVTNWRRGDVPALVRALIENIGNFVAQDIEEMLALGVLTREHQPIPVSGGLSDLDFLMQYIADVSGVELARLGSREASARGAAIASMQSFQRTFSRVALPRPQISRTFRRENEEARMRFQQWRALRERAATEDVSEDLLLSLEAEAASG